MIKKLGLCFAIVGLLAGCAANTTHTAKNSLSWGGVYQGVLPCADCEGIKTTLVLNYDGTFSLSEEYKKGLMTFLPQAVEGNIIWDEQNPSLIILGDNVTSRVYFVGENYIRAYGMDKQPIQSSLNYTLNQIEHFDANKVVNPQ